MATYQSKIEALNHIVGLYGGSGSYQISLDALNAIVVAQGGPGGFDQDLDAINEWVRILGGTGNFDQDLAAYSEISRLAGGESDFDQTIDALNEITSLSLGGGGGGGYTAQAVHFDGATSLSNASLVSTDNAFLAFSTFFRTNNTGDTSEIWVSDPQNTFSNNSFVNPVNPIFGAPGAPESEFVFCVGDASSLVTNGNITNGPNPNDNTWHHVLCAAKVGLGAGNNLWAVYLDDVLLTYDSFSNGDAMTCAVAGLQMAIGEDTFGLFYIGDLCNLRIMPGINLLDGGTSSVADATRRLFSTSLNKPVDPSVATTALGAAGAVLLSGDATGFAANQGTGGTFALTGALTNATTSPSD